MKTSFYFVLWILIYPLLGLLNNSAVNEHAFLVAIIVVYGISWLLNRLMPDTIAYENALLTAPILEDVYTGNVESFQKRLSKYTLLESITGLYFVITSVVIAITIFMTRANDWFALIIFVFFAIGAISRSLKFLKAKSQLKENPTAEQCMEIADDTYSLDYAAYYEMRNATAYSEVLPSKPRYFGLFKAFTITFAVIAIILGLFYIVGGIGYMCMRMSMATGALAGMIFLYGSLAAYYGIKDFLSCISSKR